MAGVENSHLDLECGTRRRSPDVSDGASSDEDSVRFSDADEGSCYSQFYSTHDDSCDDYSFACVTDREIAGVSSSRRVSAAAESDCSVEVENGVVEIKVNLEKLERVCRICHLTLESTSSESGVAIELGCSCKNDLAAAHKHCAEAWFKIRGNKTCEICNSVARNVFVTIEVDPSQQTRDTNVTTAHAHPVSAPMLTTVETQSCLNGHRILNFLLACMVFAFVISWLFHFNIPS